MIGINQSRNHLCTIHYHLDTRDTINCKSTTFGNEPFEMDDRWWGAPCCTIDSIRSKSHQQHIRWSCDCYASDANTHVYRHTIFETRGILMNKKKYNHRQHLIQIPLTAYPMILCLMHSSKCTRLV